MMSSMKLFMMMVFMVIASMQMQSSMAQTRHVVGDALGWTIPAGGAAAYTTWASQQTFNVGDTLFFNFTTGFHDVAEVSQAAYGPCTTANPISTATTGPATLTLTAAGPHYYICTFGTHCQIGQKLAINVSGVAPAAPPTTTSPPASPPTTRPPTATPTPAPLPTPVSPPTTTPSPAPVPSTTIPPRTSSPAPSPVGASPPSPTPSGPSASDRPTPSPAADTPPTPPSPNTAARSLTVVAPATLFAVALAFLY